MRVPSSVAAPIVYTPMEVDTINQFADETAKHASHVRLPQPNFFLTAGVVSVEDRSKRDRKTATC